MRFGVFILLLLTLFSGCSSSVFFEIPYEFRFPEKKEAFYKNYSKYLIGKKFFLDPGHGGTDRNNKGFKGNAVEADANLNVALNLRNFLTSAGASVIMSRDKDTTVALKDRSILANKSGADFFISIHHNAPADSNDYWTNYSATYYHALDTNYEFDPSERDLARYIQRDLSYAMRNSGGPASFDGTQSDYSIYPKQGFSVLRLTEIPSVLVECGFTTSSFESQRITIEEFNKIEAWGIFRGICRYLAAGIPSIVASDINKFSTKEFFDVFIKDTLKIDTLSFNVFMDTLKTRNFFYNNKASFLHIDLSNLNEGEHTISISAANVKGNHTLPFRRKILITDTEKR